MTHSTRTVLLAQVLISAMMAGAMTGIFGLVALGPTEAFLAQWGKTFLTAWPIAFVLSMAIGPLAFKLAHQLDRLLP
ncbi:DUF2798 domain-containing protein [Paracoccaceae bacterium Fryx2]|nr:DUF2798 domain-containing protein [Paracoccaceae bacterium Fryx2]